jgi:predicted flavoprotein YhiN
MQVDDARLDERRGRGRGRGGGHDRGVAGGDVGVPVLLLEKKSRLGTKILISGGGKCNVTHDGPMDEIRQKFRPNEARFLRPRL